MEQNLKQEASRAVGVQENVTLILNEEVIYNLKDVRDAKGEGLIYAIVKENEDQSGADATLGILNVNNHMVEAALASLIAAQFSDFISATGLPAMVAGKIFGERMSAVIAKAMASAVEL